jgi:hypothetical protein
LAVCCESNLRNSSSAGGQLEHPSEVNNSTKIPGLTLIASPRWLVIA